MWFTTTKETALAPFNPCPGNGFFATFAGNWGVFFGPPGLAIE